VATLTIAKTKGGKI